MIGSGVRSQGDRRAKLPPELEGRSGANAIKSPVRSEGEGMHPGAVTPPPQEPSNSSGGATRGQSCRSHVPVGRAPVPKVTGRLDRPSHRWSTTCSRTAPSEIPPLRRATTHAVRRAGGSVRSGQCGGRLLRSVPNSSLTDEARRPAVARAGRLGEERDGDRARVVREPAPNHTCFDATWKLGRVLRPASCTEGDGQRRGDLDSRITHLPCSARRSQLRRRQLSREVGDGARPEVRCRVERQRAEQSGRVVVLAVVARNGLTADLGRRRLRRKLMSSMMNRAPSRPARPLGNRRRSPFRDALVFPGSSALCSVVRPGLSGPGHRRGLKVRKIRNHRGP